MLTISHPPTEAQTRCVECRLAIAERMTADARAHLQMIDPIRDARRFDGALESARTLTAKTAALRALAEVPNQIRCEAHRA